MLSLSSRIDVVKDGMGTGIGQMPSDFIFEIE